MSDDTGHDQELLPRDGESEDTATGKEIAVGSKWSSVIEALQGTTYGLRKQKQKVEAQTELVRAYREGEGALHALMQTAERLEQDETLHRIEFASKQRAYDIRDLEQNLAMDRLRREAVEERNRAELLTLEHDLRRAQLELELEEIKQRRLALQGATVEPEKAVIDPNVEQARTAIKRYMDRHQYLGADKRQWFEQIEGDLARGAISREMAEEMKEDIEQIIRDNILAP